MSNDKKEAVQTHIDALVDKAVKANDCDAAMRFSQAALNSVHAYQVLGQIKGTNPVSGLGEATSVWDAELGQYFDGFFAQPLAERKKMMK